LSSDPLWVFGYGSLVSPASMARTLRRDVPTGDGWAPAVLHGYGRRWNYGSSRVGARWMADEELVENGLVVALGLVAADEWCNGVITRLRAGEIEDIDRREANYVRTDVTSLVETDLAIDGRVVTYVPSPDAVERYEYHRDRGRAGVAARYIDLVRRAFDDLGSDHRRWFDESTPPPDVPIVDLDAIEGNRSPRHWYPDD
jgi:cation transport regulator ChaC